MTDNALLYRRTTELICEAVAADSQGKYIKALVHYNNALRSIMELRQQSTGQQRAAIEPKFCEYARRMGLLLRQTSDIPTYYSELDKAQDALEAIHRQCTSGGDVDTSIKLYVTGITCYQKILRLEKTAALQSTPTRKSWRRELHRFAEVCLKEAESAKEATSAFPAASDLASHSSSPTLTATSHKTLSHLQQKLSGLSFRVENEPATSTQEEEEKGELHHTPRFGQNNAQLTSKAAVLIPGAVNEGVGGSSSSSISTMGTTGGGGRSSKTNGSGNRTERLTAEESQVIRTTSHLNGLTFLPWLDDDSDEKFEQLEYFTDDDGLLRLSPKQQRKLLEWRRASQIFGSAPIFGQQGCAHIVQETVTDCSFVAALCVSMEYEQRFGRQLITRHMYPRTPTGLPAFNPAGKYMVKLFVNGLWRRVVIDDLLPVAENGKLLCTYSTAGDIGQSLMEKAFLKVMGGYDFPGSNSSTDLYVLTGWIPEHIFIQDQAFDSLRTWTRMLNGLHNGDVLLTIATGEMGNDLAAQLGLVPSHAYAVLDVREVCGHRLVMVKNPWSSLRWTGKFSHTDHVSWTPELMQQLGYDPATESDDRGVFWIDYDSICHRFDAIHLNWSPAAFNNRASVHFAWELGMGPRQAIYNFGANPQFTLSVGGRDGSTERQLVWVLLSKHLLKTEENRDFIALHIYDGRNGRRIYEPREAMHIGEYVNTQHVLVQLEATPYERYTLVIAQREKTKPLYFALRVFSDALLVLNKAPVPAFEEEVKGQWGSASAGGNTASPRYLDNPQYQLTIANSPGRTNCSGVITLESAQKHPVNLRVFRSGFLVTRVLEINTIANSGKYRSLFCASDVDGLEPGSSYTIVASTFEPFMFSRFKLRVGLDCPFVITPIPREGAGMRQRELHGRWVPGTDCSGGPVDQCCARNPRFLVCANRQTDILARLQTPQAEDLPLINLSIFEFSDAVLGRVSASSGSYTNSPQGVATRRFSIGTPKTCADAPAEYLVVASTWDQDVNASFVLYFYSEHEVSITPIVDFDFGV